MIDLDKVVEKRNQNTTEPEAKTEPEVETTESTEAESPEPETESPDPEPQAESVDAESDAEAEKPENPDQSKSEPAPVGAEAELDLDEYEVEVDGESRSINSLLDERDELAARIKEIESDDFLKRFIDYYKKTGDASAFIQSQSVDWDKASDIDVLRRNFDSENSDLDQETRDLLFQEELKNKYKVDPDDDDIDTESKLYKIGQGLLKRDAEKARAKFKEEQKNFSIPEQKQQVSAYNPEEYRSKIVAQEEMSKFLQSKLIKLEVADEDNSPLGYEVENPASIIEMMTSDAKFWSLFQKDGKVDLVKQAKVYAYAQDPAAFEKQLVELGKTLGTAKTLKEKRNTDDILSNKKSTMETADDFKTSFLKELKRQNLK